jgi:AraC-like DNA-binding protein
MSPLSPASQELPLAFGNRRASVEHDPDQLAQQVGRAVPLRDLSPCRSAERFVHRSAHVQASGLGITAAAHSPLHGANHAHNRAVFTLPTLGEKRFHVAGRTYRARAGHGALFLPGEAYTLQTTTCSGVMFTLCPGQLATVASAMAGPDALPFQPTDRPLQFLESHPQQGKLLSLMRRSLQLIDLATVHGPTVSAQLGLEDKLQRLMALLIYPHLTSHPTPPRPGLGKREQVSFAALLEAIQHDPMETWTLTRMERQACLSRLQLLHQFRVLFDLQPLEWLRHQRLCWARQHLDTAEQPMALEVLALRCGFKTLASFRHHFEGQFQVAPEALGRRWSVSPG